MKLGYRLFLQAVVWSIVALAPAISQAGPYLPCSEIYTCEYTDAYGNTTVVIVPAGSASVERWSVPGGESQSRIHLPSMPPDQFNTCAEAQAHAECLCKFKDELRMCN